MSLYELKTEQKLPISLEAAWDFLSSPRNLKTITPPYMGFDITSDLGDEKMYAGQIISYKVRPLLNLPMTWVTEITHVHAPYYFVDEQRHGPYALWHHKHFLEPIEGGVAMRDIVHYMLPLGPLGDIANAVLVRKQLATIFEYRRTKLIELFGEWK